MTLDRNLTRSLLVLLLLIFAAVPLKAASPQPVQITLYWEGRQLQEPNIDALEKLRIAYPQVPLLHLINPSYFLGTESAEENLQIMLRVLQAEDEVGLYLSSIESLIKAAQVPVRSKLNFWGSVDNHKICESDCGLDVPLSGRSREEMLQIFLAADKTLRKVGFEGMKSYSLRGWLFSPFMPSLAASFAYRYDHTPLAPSLISSRLRKYPFVSWVKDLWTQAQTFAQTKPGSEGILPVNGSVIELSEPQVVTKSFERFLAEALKEPEETQPAFQIVFSQEAAYFGALRLRGLLKDLDSKSREKNLNLVYITPSQAKNGRPKQENMRISKEF